jgi:transposase
VKDYLAQSHISVVSLPPHSSDLNRIENFWKELKSIIYRGGKSYDSIKELQTALGKACNEYPQEKINNIVSSLGNCMIAVVEEHGSSTKY